MSADHLRFKGVDNIGDALLGEQLEANLVSWFNWAMLGIGGFTNVTIASSGAYGGADHRLYLASDPYYDDGQIWQAGRQDWVWETGVGYPHEPIRVSGVYVNGGFHPTTGTGPYAHSVNYPLGRVVFDQAISPTSTVSCEHSYRYAHCSTSDVPWWRQLQLGSLRSDDSHLAQDGSGAWAVLSQSRTQLPAVIVQVTDEERRAGLQLGGGHLVHRDVLFHIVAEAPWEKRQLHDILTAQKDKRTVLFNKNWVADASAFPVDDEGSPVAGAKMYPQMVAPTGEGGYGWKQLRFIDFRSIEQPLEQTAPFYATTIRGAFEVEL